MRQPNAANGASRTPVVGSIGPGRKLREILNDIDEVEVNLVLADTIVAKPSALRAALWSWVSDARGFYLHPVQLLIAQRDFERMSRYARL